MIAPVIDWRRAYFIQATSDYKVLLLMLRSEDVNLCHKLHYLQMATEKMAKGFLTRQNGSMFPKTHDALVGFMRQARLNAALQGICGIGDKKSYIAYIQALSPLAQTIEDLSPEGTPHANPEYPWEVGGKIEIPSEFDFPSINLSEIKMQKMLIFLSCCFKLIERES